jgi:Polysaccharide deacetylase
LEHPLKIFITVDVELWPTSWGRHRSEFTDSFNRYILGKTSRGAFGLPFQLQMAQDHGLRFTFFVETLFACEFGLSPLTEIVQMVQEAGQEVQLHAHAEWIRHSARPLLSTGERFLFRDFSEDEQYHLVQKALSNLSEAGAKNPRVFRAGSFAGNADTLRAVRRAGLTADSSFKLGSQPVPGPSNVIDRDLVLEGIKEYPLSVFRDWPGHFRHVQIGSCSARELQHVAVRAHLSGWSSLVVLSHSVEMLGADRSRPDRIVLRRFERFCRFLADSKENLVTSWFTPETSGPHEQPRVPIRSSTWCTLERMSEQILSRILS